MKAVKYLLLAVFALLMQSAYGQMTKDESNWTFEAKKKSGNDYELQVHLKLPKDWHIWSMKPGGDGMQTAPEIKFEKNAALKLKSVVKEHGKLIDKIYDGVDGMTHSYHDRVDYTQEATITSNTIIKGTYYYQICNESLCLLPTKKSFSIKVTDAGGTAVIDTAKSPDAKVAAVDSAKDGVQTSATSVTAPIDTNKNVPVVSKAELKAEQPQNKSLLWLFLEALAGGILAVLTPCVYSMIPITVSFFTKRSKTRAEGLRNAAYYSLSIVLIFTVLGILISLIFGANALNTLSTNWIANLFFFAVFVIFGISFLGAFEITLPSSWTSKTDSKAGLGSFAGIFFMALTLVIVSFSCTGPIVGPLLVLAGKGGIAGPAIGMFGFSVGLALPFALFAVFPGLLNKMASSGGWLNQVKVVLGFIELMLALKFFSNADLAMGWRLLDREIFIAIWIVLAVLLGMYLLGKLKLSHDDATPKNLYGQEYVSLFKLFLANVGCTAEWYERLPAAIGHAGLCGNRWCQHRRTGDQWAEPAEICQRNERI
jgi:thiol:disulfide interchange protein DsbD